MLVTSDMIWNELKEQRKLIERLLEKDAEHSIEELSLNKAAKLLHMGSESVVRLVEKGFLKPRIYRDGKRRKRYRFRIADIRQFQTEKTFAVNEISIPEGIETAEEIAARIFKKGNN